MSAEVFHASNGIRLEIPGGWVLPDDASRVQADPGLLIQAHAEARGAGARVGLADQAASARPAPAEPYFRTVPLVGLEADTLPPVRYALRPLIPSGGYVTLLGGHGGAGKSSLALALSAHVAAGRRWSGLEVEPGRVVYLSLEDESRLLRDRVRRICAAYGLPVADVAESLCVLDGTDGDAALAVEHSANGLRLVIETEAMDAFRVAAVGASLIVVDNASDAFAGDENNRRQVRAFMRMLVDVARANDAGLVLLAHVDKSAAKFGANRNSYSGSTAWHNSARSRLALTERDGRIELIQEKHNLGPAAEPVPLFWSASGVLMPAGLTVGREIQSEDEQALLQALADAQAQGVDVGAGRTGPATAQAVLGTFPSLPVRLRGRNGRDAFWSALGRLLARGEVEVQQITTASRHPKRVLVLADPCADFCARNSPIPPCAEPAKPAQACGDSLVAETGANPRNRRSATG